MSSLSGALVEDI